MVDNSLGWYTDIQIHTSLQAIAITHKQTSKSIDEHFVTISPFHVKTDVLLNWVAKCHYLIITTAIFRYSHIFLICWSLVIVIQQLLIHFCLFPTCDCDQSTVGHSNVQPKEKFIATGIIMCHLNTVYFRRYVEWRRRCGVWMFGAYAIITVPSFNN